MNIKSTLSTLASAFGAGSLGWAETHLTGGIPTTSQALIAFAASAAAGGFIAIAHLYQSKPGGLDAQKEKSAS